MTKWTKNISEQFKNINTIYKKSSIWFKILVLLLLFLMVVSFFNSIRGFSKRGREGFEQQEQFTFHTGPAIFDNYYVDIYDHLVYNSLKNDFEIGQIINSTKPTSESIILDIGSGTGHHVSALAQKGLQVTGIDNSEAMVKRAKENFPTLNFEQGDAEDAMLFHPNSFTHILCLYFTIYYMKDKTIFFNNCMNWLMPGGYLVLHLVNRDMFDPIIPPANPLLLVSPQRYAKQRITHSNVQFNDFKYSSNFNLDKLQNVAKFEEKFKYDQGGKSRKQEHVLYMESQTDILTQAKNAGFIIHGQVDMVKTQYEYQYLYILMKPN